jgi:hypothetical protein
MEELKMSLTALRQAALASRRFPVGAVVEVKRPGGDNDGPSEKSRKDLVVQPEPHWQASIEAATD